MKNPAAILKFFILLLGACVLFAVSCKNDDDKPDPPKPYVLTDIDGNTYPYVTIGAQVWMAKNLKVTKLKDGTDIPLIADPLAWSNLATPGYCWYDNDQATYGNTYGAMYNWYTVNTGKLCPAGWHVPSDDEWTLLTDFLGGEPVAGGKLKSITYWNSPNTGATNETGFAALPGGVRGYGSAFHGLSDLGYWYSATEYNFSNVYTRSMHHDHAEVEMHGNDKKTGMYVRCVKD